MTNDATDRATNSNQLGHVGIVVPARNEETLLPRCLASVLQACSLLPANVTHDVVVVADSSNDRTLGIAEAMVSFNGTAAKTDAAAVGRTRSIATALMLSRYRGPLNRCWVANTDADCVVPPDWLNAHVRVATRGFEAVAGTVEVDSFDEHASGVDERFRASYILFADGSHPLIHGANLGVRADAYLRAGGWGDLSTGEDHDLWTRLLNVKARCTSVSSIKVLTSGRLVGRAPLGFAAALLAHGNVNA